MRFAGALRHAAESRPDGCVPYPEDLWPPEGSMPEEQRRRYIARMRPQPLATMIEPLHLTGAITRVPRAYVHCVSPAEEVMRGFAARAREAGWPYRESATAHDLHLQDPEGTCAMIDGLLASWPQQRTVT